MRPEQCNRHRARQSRAKSRGVKPAPDMGQEGWASARRGGCRVAHFLDHIRGVSSPPQCAMHIRLARQVRGDPLKEAQNQKQTVGRKALREPVHPCHGKGITSKVGPAQASVNSPVTPKRGQHSCNWPPRGSWSKAVSNSWARTATVEHGNTHTKQPPHWGSRKTAKPTG